LFFVKPTYGRNICLFLCNKTAKIIFKNKNWLQFLFFVKAAAVKQQISKLYLQVLCPEGSFYIYYYLLAEINVMASFCASSLQVNF